MGSSGKVSAARLQQVGAATAQLSTWQQGADEQLAQWQQQQQ
jgi:hypothetical protein